MASKLTLGEVKARKDQGDFRLTDAYFLQLDHGLMGTFPAVLDEDLEKIVVCTDRELLRQVWDHLPRRRAKVTKITAYVSDQEKLGFMVDCMADDKTKAFKLFTGEELDAMFTANPEAVCWAPGLFSLKDESQARCPLDN